MCRKETAHSLTLILIFIWSEQGQHR